MSAPRRSILPLFIPHLGCPHDCVFCSQKRISGRMFPVTPEDVAEALEALPGRVDELAFYGGSFTALPPAEQRALLDAAQGAVAAGRLGSIRVSTRPDAIDAKGLELLRSRHVETVELGAQSMDDGVLRRSGRGHSAADTVRAARAVKDGGFRLVLQMMTGLPGSSDESDFATAQRLCALRPDGVRIYPTVILRDTPLYSLWRRGEYREHSVEDAVRICARILPLFRAADIPVIRLGLNPSDNLSAGDAVGGAYHPALGELVQSRVLLEKARALLHGSMPGTDAVLGVCKSDVSKMIGQHRQNLTVLQTEYRLRSLRVRETPQIPEGEIIVVSESTRNPGL